LVWKPTTKDCCACVSPPNCAVTKCIRACRPGFQRKPSKDDCCACTPKTCDLVQCKACRTGFELKLSEEDCCTCVRKIRVIATKVAVCPAKPDELDAAWCKGNRANLYAVATKACVKAAGITELQARKNKCSSLTNLMVKVQKRKYRVVVQDLVGVDLTKAENAAMKSAYETILLKYAKARQGYVVYVTSSTSDDRRRSLSTVITQATAQLAYEQDEDAEENQKGFNASSVGDFLKKYNQNFAKVDIMPAMSEIKEIDVVVTVEDNDKSTGNPTDRPGPSAGVSGAPATTASICVIPMIVTAIYFAVL